MGKVWFYRRSFSIFILCIALAGTLLAQDPRGSILGRVVDQSNAVIPGVHVRATNAATGVSVPAISNEAGIFSVPFLPAGTYTISAGLAGFKQFVQDGVAVRVGEATDLTVRMQVGEVSETVQVTGQTPLLDTASASLGLVIDKRRMEDLPARGGNPLELSLLTPGVTNTGAYVRLLDAGSPDGSSNLSTDGAGMYNNEFQMDGISNNATDVNDAYSRVAFVPPSTAVQEFKMQTSAYDASIGHTTGGVLNVSTASGTNQLHGEMHYWGRYSALAAPNFFNNKAGTKPPVYQEHRYGVSSGGPVYVPKVYDGRNRTFWFYAWDANPSNTPRTNTNTVPTAAERQGDFSELLNISGGSRYQIYNPFTTRPAPNGRFQRDPFPNNVLPKSLLDPLGLKLASLYPLPNYPGTVDGRNNHFFGSENMNDSYFSHLGRFDQTVSQNYRLFVRLNYSSYWINKGNNFGNEINGIRSARVTRGLAADNVFVLSPSLVLNVRYGLTNAEFTEYRKTRGYDLASLGFSQALISLTDSRLAPIPRIVPDVYSSLSKWESGDGGNTSLTHSWAAAFTKLHRQHNLKFGADFRVYRTFGNRYPRADTPDLSFSTTYTKGPLDNAAASPIGQGLAAMLLGIPGGQMDRNASYANQDKYLGAFLQDDFKVSRKLTLNLGLRYEYESPVTERYNRLVSSFAFDAANAIQAQARANYARNPIAEVPVADFRVLGGLTWVNQAGNGRSPFQAQKSNFAPRIGLAYAIDSKTTVRGGYGMFFDTIGVAKTYPTQTGFSRTTPIQASLDNGQTFLVRTANPFPNGLLAPLGPAGGLTTNLGMGLSFYNPKLTHPYAQRWSFGLQRLLPAQVLLEGSYVGNRGTRIGVDRELNDVPTRYLSRSPVRDQQTIDYLTAQFPNPFYGLDPIYGTTMSRRGLLVAYPEFGSMPVTEPVGYSWYHALQVKVEKRLSKGFTYQLGYTYSKLMEAIQFMNAGDPMPYESISSLDRPHRLAMNAIWEIPVGRGRSFGSRLPGAVNFVLGGWQLSGIVIRQAGAPLGFGNALFIGDVQNIALPKSERTVDHWFNTTAGFNRVSSQQLSSNFRTFPLRFSGVRGDGQASWDFAIVKNFAVRERMSFQFRGEIYNAWNHPNFDAPDTSPTSSSFGTITSMKADGRNAQLILRIKF